MRRLWIASCLILVAHVASAAGPAPAAPAGGAGAASEPKPGHISGRVMLAPGVPAPACRVTGESASLSASCNASGSFMIKEVQPGTYELRINVAGLGETRVSVGVGDGQGVWLGDIIVGMPGAVSGTITTDNSSDFDLTVIGVPELGVYTQPNITGGYLLAGIPPGNWNVTIYPPNQNATFRPVAVLPGQLIRKVDFEIKTPVPPKPAAR